MKDIPTSVYRLQLSENFPLKEATKLLPYLKQLGIEAVYCSPYFKAHSPHGYDILDPNTINPLIATPGIYETFCKTLKKLGIQQMADIVPNHMGIVGDNKWFKDVLKKGKKSKYAPFFDIYWDKGKIKIPLLGAKYPKSPYFELVHWRNSEVETHYRRFFNINDLIGIRIEDPTVFAAHHKWIFQLLKTGKVQALRIDHPDGLYDPSTYFKRLRQKHKGLIFVEKILGWKEELPKEWPVDGTVGYEFLNMLTGLFVKKSKTLTDVYTHFTRKKQNFHQMVISKKKLYMNTEMAGDVENLADLLEKISPISKKELIQALQELLAHFPVYRSYIPPNGPVPTQDKPYIAKAFVDAKKPKKALDYLHKIFTLKIDNKITRDFLMRFQQLSAPIMAKGFEDITLYNYNRLLALNEVGSEPQRQGITPQEFHNFCKQKQKTYPLGLLPTSTHDTKRSMEVRMQIAVLSEMPELWEKALKIFSKLNQKYKTNSFPEPNAEYFFYQILLGAYPSNPSATRMWHSFQKSIREARVHTSWREPNKPYEKACEHFVRSILKKNSPFLQKFENFQKQIVDYGNWNHLSAIALQMGCPGIVDIYQGHEHGRFTLVDPDNRGKVRYPKAKNDLFKLTQKALHFRKSHKDLFLKGEYIPLKIHGEEKAHVIAFLRRYKKETCLIAAVCHTASLNMWTDTHINLPKNLGRGEEVFFGDPIQVTKLWIPRLFRNAPYAWVYWNT